MKIDKPSLTALFVAHGMYYNMYQENLKDEIPGDLKKYSIQLIDYIYNLRSNFSKRKKLFECSIIELLTLKGFFLHFLVRKKCIETSVRSAIKEGAEQVFILGAGYDTLGARLANQFPGIKIIELDHPATTKNKLAIFKGLQWNYPNVNYISGDLNNIEDILKHETINKTLKTIFVCEGVLMYLPEIKVAQILDSLYKNFSEQCTFVFSFMEENKPGDYYFRNTSYYMKFVLLLKNEPFNWGIPSHKLKEFVSISGWQVTKLFDYKKLKDDFLLEKNKNLPTAVGENIVICVKQ